MHSVDGAVHYKSAYHGKIAIGLPEPQVLDVVFDTGSGHLVVPSSLCYAPTCLKHVRYRRKASLTAVDIDSAGSEVVAGEPRDQVTVFFGTGEITGVLVRDHVCLGHSGVAMDPTSDDHPSPGLALMQTNAKSLHKGSSPLTEDEVDGEVDDEDNSTLPDGCYNAQFIVATDMSEDPFNTFSFDGVLGLGLVELSQTPDFNIFNVFSSGAWKVSPGFQRTFAVFLGFGTEMSAITFGGYQAEHLHGDAFAWHHVRDPLMGYWQIEIVGITANGTKLDYCDDGTCRAILDTGTSLLAVPSSIAVTLFDHLRFANHPGKPCDADSPALLFYLGNITLELTPSDIARPEVIDGVGDGENEALTGTGEAQDCLPMVMAIDLPEPLSKKTFILGEPVLQKYYTAFDMDNSAPKVGIGLARHTVQREPRRVRR